ncbi:MAG: hypothetical protein AAFQ98_19215 [Bacteroidota bacterium]
MESTNNSITIPPKHRKEWKDLVTNVIDHRFQNYVLQMKTAEYSKKIAKGIMDADTAVDELFELCLKYSKAVQNDFKLIFKTW